MTDIEKEILFKEIDKFVDRRKGRSKLYEVRFYVDTLTAKDRADFFKYILTETEHFSKDNLKKIIDFTFGSGNLSAHLLLNSDISYDTLILNDINKEDINKTVSIGVKRYSDLLDTEQFSDLTKPFDLIIFNPQLGGKETYPDGILDIESIDPIIYKINKNLRVALEEYVDMSDCTFSEDKDNKSIMIHSDILSKAVMNKRFKHIKIFNYYDFFYQSKKTKIEGTHSNLVKFRKTFDHLSNKNTIIVMLADEKDFEKFFGDFNYFVEYLPAEGKRLFVGKKNAEEGKQRICYERDEESFKVNESCSLKSSGVYVMDVNLSDLVQDIDKHLAYLKSIEGKELTPLKTTQGTDKNEVKERKKKPFKNFLREDY